MNMKYLLIAVLFCVPLIIGILASIPDLHISSSVLNTVILFCIVGIIIVISYLVFMSYKKGSLSLREHTQREVLYECAKNLSDIHYIDISYNLYEGSDKAKYNATTIEAFPVIPKDGKEWYIVKIEARTRKSKEEDTRILLFVNDSLQVKANYFTFASRGKNYYKNIIWENPELFFMRGVSKAGTESALMNIIKNQLADEDGNVDLDELAKLSSLKGIEK